MGSRRLLRARLPNDRTMGKELGKHDRHLPRGRHFGL
jgi:hypothetical protein